MSADSKHSAPAGRRNIATGGAKPVRRRAKPVVGRFSATKPRRGVGKSTPPANDGLLSPLRGLVQVDRATTGCARRSTDLRFTRGYSLAAPPGLLPPQRVNLLLNLRGVGFCRSQWLRVDLLLARVANVVHPVL